MAYQLLDAKEEEELYRTRLLNVEEKPLKRITKRLATLRDVVALSARQEQTPPPEGDGVGSQDALPNTEHISQLREDITLDFAALDATVARFQLLHQANARERARYDADRGGIVATCQTVRADMTALRGQLEQARATLAQRKMYDTMADAITTSRTLRPRPDQQASIAKLEDECRQLERDGEAYAATWRERRQQFARIMGESMRLRRQIRDEKEEVDRREGMDEEGGGGKGDDGKGDDGKGDNDKGGDDNGADSRSAPAIVVDSAHPVDAETPLPAGTPAPDSQPTPQPAPPSTLDGQTPRPVEDSQMEGEEGEEAEDQAGEEEAEEGEAEEGEHEHHEHQHSEHAEQVHSDDEHPGQDDHSEDHADGDEGRSGDFHGDHDDSLGSNGGSPAGSPAGSPGRSPAGSQAGSQASPAGSPPGTPEPESDDVDMIEAGDPVDADEPSTSEEGTPAGSERMDTT